MRSGLVFVIAAAAFMAVAVSAGYQKSLVIDWGSEWTKVGMFFHLFRAFGCVESCDVL